MTGCLTAAVARIVRSWTWLVIDQLPRGSPPRRFAAAEREATSLYRSLWPQFHELATVAIIASILVVVATCVACAWNHRRPTMDAVTRDLGALVALIAGLLTVDAARRKEPVLIDFDELPSGATQRFELTH